MMGEDEVQTSGVGAVAAAFCGWAPRPKKCVRGSFDHARDYQLDVVAVMLPSGGEPACGAG